MASWVLSECGFKPLAPVFPQPRTGCFSKPPKIGSLHMNTKPIDSNLCYSNLFPRNRLFVPKVSAPFKTVAPLEEEDEKYDIFNGVVDEVEEFDPGAVPPFKLSDIRAAIPKHCWVKDPLKSMTYVVRDVAVVLGLAVAAAYVNNWLVWPLYWVAQGTMFWALFVLGHDW